MPSSGSFRVLLAKRELRGASLQAIRAGLILLCVSFSQTGAAQTLRFQPGPVMSVYLIEGVPDFPSDQRGAMAPSFIQRPSGMALGETRSGENLFSPTPFLQDKAMKAFHDAPIGLSWDGYLLLKDEGEHLLSMLLHVKGHEVRGSKRANPVCSASVSINGITIASVHKIASSGRRQGASFATSMSRYGSSATVFSNDWRSSGKLSVDSAGLFEASVWLACLGVQPDKVSVSVHLKHKTDAAPMRVTPYEFLRL